MRTNLYPISLNGIGLNALDPRIRVVDVEEDAPKIRVTTAARAKYDGLRVTRRERSTRTVTVRFVIWEKNKPERMALHGRVVEWADAGGALMLGSRDGMQLQVVCEKLPDVSGKDWMDELVMQFAAYDPYWRGIDAATVRVDTAAGAAKTANIRPNGTAKETFLEFEITNTGTMYMTSATISVNGLAFVLEGFTLAVGKTLEAAYDTDGFLHIAADGVSAMSKRTAASADDLVLRQREENVVTVTTNRPAKVLLRAWEQYL